MSDHLIDPVARSAARPSGTVTFLFTDIEGSTRLLQQLDAAYPAVLLDHDRLIEAAVQQQGGRVFGHEGDAVFAAFGDAPSAVRAAIGAQRALGAHPWPFDIAVRVRMALHTGDVVWAGGSYVGLPLHQVARIAATAHGGQVVASQATKALAAAATEPDIEWRDLGAYDLRDLPRSERLYQVSADGLRDEFPPLRSTSRHRDNLPVQLTSFVGRAELEAAQRLLAGTRLLTLTGPGGTGKTRLALRLAAAVSGDFPDGTFFVALDAIDDPALVPSAVAQALDVDPGLDPPLERVAREFRDRRALLVLDNFEQVVDAAADVTTLLTAAPAVKIVATSRILLRVTGEQQFDVPPLSLPAGPDDAAGSEAVRLFVDRAVAAQPSFVLDGANAAAVVDIVRRLDGLPLAIELAAARIRLLPVEALRARLDSRLSVLVGGARDRPGRQQTLRGAIEWSYDLLEGSDRGLFERFSVAAGSASLAQAEAFCGPAEASGGDVLDGLGSLADKSLLRSVAGVDHEPRFAMLATIREYAAERLASRPDAEAVRSRHAWAFLALATTCRPHLTGRQADRFLERLELDHDNFRAAIDWAVASGEAALAHRFGAALWRFWQVRGHLDEARDRLDRILAMPGATDLEAGVRAAALGAAGSVAYWRGDRGATWRWYQAALVAARLAGDKAVLAEALVNAAFEPSPPDDRPGRHRFGEGRPLLEEGLQLYRELGDEPGLAGATWALGIAELALGDRASARGHLEESLALYRRLGEPFGEGWALHMLGLVDVVEGDLASAEARFRAAIPIFRASADVPAAALLLLDAALLAQRRDERERFWTLAGASDAWAQRSGTGLASNLEAFIDLERPVAPAEPEEAGWWQAGSRMTIDEAFDYGLGVAVGEPNSAR